MSLFRICRQDTHLAARALFASIFITLASCGGGGGSGSSTPPAPTLQSVDVSPTNPSTAAGDTQQFSATGMYSDGSHKDVTSQVTWSSSSTAVATISSAGLATAVAAGTTTISAAMQSMTGSTQLTVTAATLSKIEVTPTNPSVAAGSTVQLTAMGVYSDNSKKDLTAQVTWSSSATGTATVSAAGLVTGVAAGMATITAKLNTVSGTDTITVTGVSLKSIEVTPTSQSVPSNFPVQYTATGIYSDNSHQDITTQVTWSSSQTSVATIAATTGLATTVAAGVTTISASLNGVASGNNSGTLTVSSASLTSITITPASPSVAIGTTQQLVATGNLSDGSHPIYTTLVTWSSDTKSVATVSNASGSNGLVTPVATGKANITATLGSVTSAPDQVTVTPAVVVSIAVTPAGANIAVNTTQQYKAVGTYSDTTTQDLTTQVTWASTNAPAATISNAGGSQGLATGVANGSTSITATFSGVTGSTPLTVGNVTLSSIAILPSNATILADGTEQFVALGTYNDGSSQDLTTTVTWSSSATTTATISNASGSQGLATAVGAVGSPSTTIGAMFGAVSGNATLSVKNEFAYAANNSDNNVSQFAIGDNTVPANFGALVANATTPTVATGKTPAGIGIDPKGRYAYVSNQTDNSVSEYAINADGTWSALSAATIGTDLAPKGITVDPTGSYVYVAAGQSNKLQLFTIGADGTLNAPAPPNDEYGIAGCGDPVAIAIDPSGKYLYVACFKSSAIAMYSIGAGGVLTSLGGVLQVSANPNNPVAIAVSPNGQFVYVVNTYDNTVASFSINPDGTLTATKQGTANTLDTPESIAITPNGQYAYVVNNNSNPNSVGQYSIGADGSLTPLTPAVVKTGDAPFGISLDPSGNFAYVVDAGDGDVTEFQINGDGTLAVLSASPIAAGNSPQSIGTAAH